MKDHVKPNGPIPSDTHPRVEHRSRKTKGPEKPDHDAGNPPDHERDRHDHPDGTARRP